jgi:adenylate kinase family enzyme
MQRVVIIGCGGSGKSTLARNLGDLLGLPVHHLDRLYWRSGWAETPKPEWTSIVEELCAQSAWIIDGNFGGTMDLRLSAADAVIFLDMPTLTCLWGVIRRLLKYRGGIRPDMSAGCPERLSLDFLWWIWTFRRIRRPAILERLRRSQTNTSSF